jgi:glycosyltransferase involved in cell wall biosynthesis
VTVLMVTGAYFPEMSGAGLQCRALIRACGDRVRFSVLTTSVDPALPAEDTVEGVPVHRVLVSADSRVARAFALPRLILATIRAAAGADIVHLHGFSTKSRVVIAIARLLGKRVIIKLTSVGHDDAVSMRRRGGGAFRSFRRADRFVGVGPRFAELHAEAGLPAGTLTVIPNGVDLERFRPAAPGEREAIRRELGLPVDRPVVLFVGFFSSEKRPDALFDAWTGTFARAPESTLVFVGRTRSDYYEVDAGIADRIRREAARLQCADRVVLIEQTDAIERWYRAADVFALTSTREGLPNVVLEAMASGLPCVVSRLPGVTDSLIADGDDGLLIDPDDRAGFASALAVLLNSPETRSRLGARARRTVAERFSLDRTADGYIALYRELSGKAA